MVGVPLTHEEIKFLITAVWNYDGMGPPRNDVLRKLLVWLTPEQISRLRQVHGPKRATKKKRG